MVPNRSLLLFFLLEGEGVLKSHLYGGETHSSPVSPGRVGKFTTNVGHYNIAAMPSPDYSFGEKLVR